MKLLLIRHGQSVANTEGRLQGQLDSPLTELGRNQARALAHRLVREGWSVSVVYASDLCRAAETAEILAADLCAPVLLDERLREHDIGPLTGIVWRDVESLYPDIWHSLHYDPEWTDIPGTEKREALRARLAAMLGDVRDRHGEDEVVMLVSHGGSLGMLLVEILGIDGRRPSPFRFGNASLSLVELRPRGPSLVFLNDTCHLDRDLH
jgi:broad specificity phosphatase PhoE